MGRSMKFRPDFLVSVLENIYYICIPVKKEIIGEQYGRLAEWLGVGLQNQLRRFESATDLTTKTEQPNNKGVRFFVCPVLAYSWHIFSEFSDLYQSLS